MLDVKKKTKKNKTYVTSSTLLKHNNLKVVIDSP